MGLMEEMLWLFQVVSSARYALRWISVPLRSRASQCGAAKTQLRNSISKGGVSARKTLVVVVDYGNGSPLLCRPTR